MSNRCSLPGLAGFDVSCCAGPGSTCGRPRSLAYSKTRNAGKTCRRSRLDPRLAASAPGRRMNKWRRQFMHAGRILVLLSVVVGNGPLAAAQAPAAREASAREARIRELEGERKAIYEEAKAVAGSDRGDAVTFKGWIDNVRARKSRMEARFRGLEDTLDKLGGSIEEIEALRKRMADEWVFGAGD